MRRRDFLKTGAMFAGGLAILGGIEGVSSTAHTRPPGVVKESTFLALCVRCGLCLDACPTRGLSTVSLLDLLSAGTPELSGYCRVFNELAIPPDPAANALWKASEHGGTPPVFGGGGTPCMLCVSACPTGALTNIDIRTARMGVAELRQETCLAWRGGVCDRCSQVCPVGAVFEAAPNQPVVSQSKCIGCHQCREVCPTAPKSIRVNPVATK
jgi:ferredoxin-type protein NapG